jgi:hypothetical protein
MASRAAAADASRDLLLIRMLFLAYEELGPTPWPKLVRIACQYGRFAKATPRDFEHLRDTTIGELFAGDLPRRSDG